MLRTKRISIDKYCFQATSETLKFANANPKAVINRSIIEKRANDDETRNLVIEYSI